MRACRSPGLIAAYHVLHRLSVPRHSPHALKSLIKNCSSHQTISHEIVLPILFSVQVVKEQTRLRGRNGRCRRPENPEGENEHLTWRWWACLESNQGPRPYQGRALTN